MAQSHCQIGVYACETVARVTVNAALNPLRPEPSLSPVKCKYFYYPVLISMLKKEPIASGSHVNAADFANRTALMLTAEKGHLVVVEMWCWLQFG